MKFCVGEKNEFLIGEIPACFHEPCGFVQQDIAPENIGRMMAIFWIWRKSPNGYHILGDLEPTYDCFIPNFINPRLLGIQFQSISYHVAPPSF